MATELIVGQAIWPDFVAEGSRKVNGEVLAGLQTDLGFKIGILGIHEQVFYDGVHQSMGTDAHYQSLVAAGVPVDTLGRRGEGVRFDNSPFTALELAQTKAHTGLGDVVLTLEEPPFRLLNDLDAAQTPPVVSFLYRTEPRQSPFLPDLLKAVGDSRVSAFVVDSHAASRAYQEVGVPQSLIEVIPNGIDLDRFVPSAEKRKAVRDELDIPDGAPTVLFIARLSDEKDVPLFVESASIFLANEPDGHIMVAGTSLSEDNQVLADLVRRHFGDSDIRSRLHLLGIRRDADSLCAAADVMALTSRNESRPLCLTEGMAAGAVPVSTDVGDARVMIEGHGIITTRNPAEIAAAWQEGVARKAELAITSEERAALGKERMLRACAKLIGRVVGRTSVFQD